MCFKNRFLLYGTGLGHPIEGSWVSWRQLVFLFVRKINALLEKSGFLQGIHLCSKLLFLRG